LAQELYSRTQGLRSLNTPKLETAQQEKVRYLAMASEKRLMEFRYFDHLIFPAASLDSAIGDWTASAHIEFSENFKIHTVVLKCGDAFQTEVQAKRFIIKQAKQWVDDRLQNAPELRLKINRKHISPSK
jgi:hypothetical protein